MRYLNLSFSQDILIEQCGQKRIIFVEFTHLKDDCASVQVFCPSTYRRQEKKHQILFPEELLCMQLLTSHPLFPEVQRFFQVQCNSAPMLHDILNHKHLQQVHVGTEKSHNAKDQPH